VGSQFLGFECATPITHINGHVPTMDELVEFLALVFLCMVDHAKLQAVFLDDFQGIDSFSWKVFRVISKKADNILLICASRSHDKQAQRRMTSVSHPDDHFRSQMIELSLGPFDMNEIRELISIVLEQSKEAISADLCADIFARSGGLPVYTVQVLENIKRTGTLCLVNGTLEWTKEGLQQKVRPQVNSSCENSLFVLMMLPLFT
jgi:predicted ATPase